MSSSNPGTRRDWGSPDSPVSDRTWAQAILAVVERRLTLRQASQAYGLQQAALHRLVRQRTLQQLRQPASLAARGGAGTSPSSDDSRFTAAPSNDRYVFPRLNPPSLGHGSPNGNNGPLPAVAPLAASMTSSPPACELTPELNDEVLAVLREQFMQQQQYDDYETPDGRYNRLEGYVDTDIADVVRAIVGRNGRRVLPREFPSVAWLAMFKRENDLVDVDDMTRRRSRASSSNTVKAVLPSQHLQQEHYNRSYELELQQYELEEQQRREDQLRWIQNRNYRQPPAPSPTSLLQHSPTQRRASYVWEDVDGTDSASSSAPQQRLRFYQQQVQQQQQQQLQPQRQARDDSKFRRSPSASSSNDRSAHSDSNASDRKYRQSNLVPAKVWEAAMEDVAIHGMSLRNAAKAHGVHFAALHRRLKKRQQHKLNMPCEPNYIPFEDEAGVVRVIHARAEMGVLLTFTELVDLLKRTALKHRSELPEEIATALVRRFQSRVEQSVRHLIIDWPSLPNNVLYRLRDANGGDGSSKDGMGAGVPAVNADNGNAPSIISGSTGSLSSSGSSSSLSPHARAPVTFPVMRKSPVSTAPATTWGNKNESNVMSGNCSSNNNNNGGRISAAATVSPTDGGRISAAASVSPTDGNGTQPNQPCMILRL